jgi:hypothetical protein
MPTTRWMSAMRSLEAPVARRGVLAIAAAPQQGERQQYAGGHGESPMGFAHSSSSSTQSIVRATALRHLR